MTVAATAPATKPRVVSAADAPGNAKPRQLLRAADAVDDRIRSMLVRSRVCCSRPAAAVTDATSLGSLAACLYAGLHVSRKPSLRHQLAAQPIESVNCAANLRMLTLAQTCVHAQEQLLQDGPLNRCPTGPTARLTGSPNFAFCPLALAAQIRPPIFELSSEPSADPGFY
jgi:hypothetical protein